MSKTTCSRFIHPLLRAVTTRVACDTTLRLNRSCSSFVSKKFQWSYSQGPSDVPLKGITVGKLLQDRVELHPDREAVIFRNSGLKKTFSQLLDEVDQLAAGLLALGLKKGDRVGIWGPNSLEWILTQYATARTGLILVNINPAYRMMELEYSLSRVGCKAIIVDEIFKDQDYYEILFQLLPELASSKPGQLHSHILPDLKIIIMMGKNEFPGTYRFSDIISAASESDKRGISDMQAKIQFDDPVNIQFTSGTTGFPKGATLTHHNIVNNSYFVGRRLEYHMQETRICMPVPLYHCFGMVIGSMMIPNHGACCIFPSPGFDAEATLKAAAEERCTSLYGVPTMFIDMLNHHNFDQYDLSSLKTGIMAGSPCPVETMHQVITKMHIPDITVCYGTTETSPVTYQSFMDDAVNKRVSTVGQPSNHVEAKVVNEDGEIVPVGVSGELCTRGYTTMLEYWNDHDKTVEVIKKDRWYFTGDIGVMDEDGFCRIDGRIKDIVIRGGENVYPLEIEQLLYKHPKIKDVQVVGVPDPRLGEEICAWIQLKENEVASEQEIKDFCKEKLSRFKVPHYVHFTDSYPLTVTGKVQKFKIREAATKILGLDHTRPH